MDPIVKKYPCSGIRLSCSSPVNIIQGGKTCNAKIEDKFECQNPLDLVKTSLHVLKICLNSKSRTLSWHQNCAISILAIMEQPARKDTAHVKLDSQVTFVIKQSILNKTGL